MTMTVDLLIEKANRKLNAAGMDKDVANIVRSVIKEMHKEGVLVGVAQAFRSYAEQDALYAQGRTKPGAIVTRARGGQSNHNYGVAVDLFQYDKDQEAIFEVGTTRFNKIVAAMKRHGMKWGGDWTGFKDYPHFELYDKVGGEKKPGNATGTPGSATASKPVTNKPATSDAAGKPYTVVSGDTLSGIAKKYKTTVANIKKWNGLKSDLIKPNQKLKVSKPKPAAAKTAIVTYPGAPLVKGSTGINVKRVQNAMKVKVTGTYNAATIAAVKAYQERKGLNPDGITGPKTWDMMF